MKFPHTIKQGSVRVKIYRAKHGFEVHHYNLAGKLIRERKPDEEEALTHARRIAQSLAKGQTNQTELNPADVTLYLSAKSVIGNRNILAVASEYMDAMNQLEGVPLTTAVREYIHRHKSIDAEITVEQCVDEMLVAKKLEQLSERWIEDLELRLRPFGEAFGALAELSGPAIEDWLTSLLREDGEEVSPRTRKNYRTAVATLVAYAVRRRYLPSDFLEEMNRVTFNTAKSARASVYSPEEMQRLMDATASHRWQSVRDVLPWLAVRAFAGVRHAEACRMNIQRDIQTPGAGRDVIVLDAEITKTQQSRVIPIPGNLLEWLKDDLGENRPLTFNKHPDDSIRLAHAISKVTPRHNGLRDSYVSYRMAIVGDAGIVAQETGHSPAILQSKYRSVRLPDGKLITKSKAEEYFEVRPKG